MEIIMIPDGIEDRFNLYKKWFKTLLIKEFLNLPTAYQKNFIVISEKFLEDCKKIHKEGKVIKEKVIKLTIYDIFPISNEIPGRGTDEKFRVYCKSSELIDKVVLPMTKEPKIGDKLCHTVYSLDGTIWYSTKEELIKNI